MADPASIISLLGTAATLTSTVLKYASGVKQASKELEELKAELTKLDGGMGILTKHLKGAECCGESKGFRTLFDTADVCPKPHTLSSKSAF